MIPFQELADLAARVRDLTGSYIAVTVSAHAYSPDAHGGLEIVYRVYNHTPNVAENFFSVVACREYLVSLLKTDQGVYLQDKEPSNA